MHVIERMISSFQQTEVCTDTECMRWPAWFSWWLKRTWIAGPEWQVWAN